MLNSLRTFALWSVLALLISISGVGVPAVEAADGDVNTLVQAIRKANADPQPDTIQLAAGGTYVLTEAVDTSEGANGLFAITSPITIVGNGATIERSADPATPPFRLFYVAEEGTLTLDNLIIRNGDAQGEDAGGSGGGIWNAGNLTLMRSTITGNRAIQNGGGIHNHAGVVIISRSVISANEAFFGGAIDNQGRGMVTLLDSTLADNRTLSHGGGIANSKAGTLTITGSTLAHNSSDEFGGALINNGTATITNSTFSGNEAEGQGGAISNGGGILNRDIAPLVINHSTFYDNTAHTGGTIFGTGRLTFKNSLIVGSGSEDACVTQLSITYEAGGDPVLYEADVTVLGINLASDESCPGFSTAEESALGVDSLADNSGPTLTHALLPGSAAVDAAADCTSADETPLLTDQRGIERPQGAACDVGAFEREP